MLRENKVLCTTVHYRKFSEIWTTRNLVHYCFAKESMGNLGSRDLLPFAILQRYGPRSISCRYNIDVYSENMGHPEPIEIVFIKKCPNLLRIFGIKCAHSIPTLIVGVRNGSQLRVEYFLATPIWCSIREIKELPKRHCGLLMIQSVLNPSNAEATFILSARTQRFLKII